MSINLHYIEKGRGESIILLHGNGEDSSYFRHQIDFLSNKYHVFAIDSRGHGKSPKGNEKLSLELMKEDLLNFIDAKSLKKANILGFSDGSNIAILFAIDYPNKVDRLILNAGNIFPKGLKEDVYQEIERDYKKYYQNKEYDKAELYSLMLNEPDIDINDLKKIKAKTLVIAGNKDMIKEEHTKLIANSIPNSILKIIEGDHFIANKNAGEFNKVILDFLENK